MCALQECSNTPLLSSKPDFVKPVGSKDSLILCSEPGTSGYSELCFNTAAGESQLFSFPHETSIENNLCIAANDKLQSKSMFKFPKNCQSAYSELNALPGEIDHLLCEESPIKTNLVHEAESAAPPSSKKPLAQRSASDYSLSKRYDESKPPIRGFDFRQNYKSSIHPLTETNIASANADYYVLNNCNCYTPSNIHQEESSALSFAKRNSLPSTCEPGCSGMHPNNLEDINNSEDKNLYKTYNLNPTVNLKIFDTESLSESGDPGNSALVAEINNQRILDETWFISSSCHTFSAAELSGSASAAQLSIASSFGDSNIPTCKICHMPAKPDDPLISPCRCTGTLHYIHCGCLMRWLEICNKRSRKPPACELCKYQFHWHKKFKVRHWQFPHCSWRDKILHTVFLISILVMIGCAIVTVMCFRQHRGNKPDLTHLELTQSEIITLICGALFFLAFFLAMYVEIKARNTIYKLLVKFIYLNQQWYIDEYDKKGENTVIDV